MTDYPLAFLLGVVEGLTEFLPVSSTAHLRITEALLNVDLSNGYWKMFSIVIQLGAILCLPIYFRRRIAEFLATFPRGVRGDRNAFSHPLTLTLLAFVCTAIPAFLLTKLIGKNLEDLRLIWAAATNSSYRPAACASPLRKTVDLGLTVHGARGDPRSGAHRR